MKSTAVKFEGQFPNGKTRIQFHARIDALHAAKISGHMLSGFNQTMAETYPDSAIRPRLRKITVTFTFP